MTDSSSSSSTDHQVLQDELFARSLQQQELAAQEQHPERSPYVHQPSSSFYSSSVFSQEQQQQSPPSQQEPVVPNHNDDDETDDHTTDQDMTKQVRHRHYSLTELVACLHYQNNNASSPPPDEEIPPELVRRVMDFRLAQQKRRQLYGRNQTATWGIYGVYQHLHTVRTDLEWAEDAAWRRQHHQPYCSWTDFQAAQQQRSKRHLYVTYSLMVLCSIMMMVEFAVNEWQLESLSVNPLIGPSAETLVKLGALDTDKIVQDGQWFRLVSPLILHAGIVHYALNVGAMYVFGGALEQAHGWKNCLWLFVLPAVGGNVLSALFLPQYISVGASGGIFGWMGACLADIMVHWNLICLPSFDETATSQTTTTRRRHVWALIWMVVEVAVNVVIGLTVGSHVCVSVCVWPSREQGGPSRPYRVVCVRVGVCVHLTSRVFCCRCVVVACLCYALFGGCTVYLGTALCGQFHSLGWLGLWHFVWMDRD